MKKIFFLMITLGLLVSACGTSAVPQTQPPVVQPSPISEADLQATAAALSQQTLQALPTQTVTPSNTPVAVTPTNTATTTATPTQAGTSTPTQNPILLTLTATLGTGTPFTSTPGPTSAPGTVIPTSSTPGSATLIPDFGSTSTNVPVPLEYGTMPPDLPGGKIKLLNQSGSETYISLQCTTNDGYHSILEYPVESRVIAKGPAGYYHFVAWVGGKKFSGNFRLVVDGDATITMYADHVEVDY
jgi:hypothetical protein